MPTLVKDLAKDIPSTGQDTSQPGPPGHPRLAVEARMEAQFRLKSARGHIDGILRMLESEDPYCIDVLQQIKAVTGALSKVSHVVLRAHLRDHIIQSASHGAAGFSIDEVMDALAYHG